MSGLRLAIGRRATARVARREHRALLRDRTPPRAPAATTAGPPAAARRPIPTRRARPRTPSAANARRARGCDRGRGSRSMPASRPTALSHRRRAGRATARPRCCDRAAELKATPLSSRALEGRIGRAAVPAAVDAHARVVRGRRVRARRPPDGPARPTSCSSRAASRCATRRCVLAPRRRRSACAPATRTSCDDAGRACDGAGGQHALAAAPPVPGARRPADAARGVRRRSRAACSPTSATATTSPARWPSLGALAGVEVRVAAPDGYQLEEVRAPMLTDDPAEAVAGADAVYTDVWVSMSDDEDRGRAPRGARALPARRRAARPRRAGRVRAALPARPPRRGDHRGRALRRPPAHLGPGGEPPPRAEGAAGAARFARGGHTGRSSPALRKRSTRSTSS